MAEFIAALMSRGQRPRLQYDAAHDRAPEPELFINTALQAGVSAGPWGSAVLTAYFVRNSATHQKPVKTDPPV